MILLQTFGKIWKKIKTNFCIICTTYGTHYYNNGTTFFAEDKNIWLMTISTPDYAEQNIARTTCQLLADRICPISLPEREFPCCLFSVLMTVEIVALKQSRGELKRLAAQSRIANPVYIRVRSVCGGSWKEETQNHYAVLVWEKAGDPCHSPPPIDMDC